MQEISHNVHRANKSGGQKGGEPHARRLFCFIKTHLVIATILTVNASLCVNGASSPYDRITTVKGTNRVSIGISGGPALGYVWAFTPRRHGDQLSYRLV